MVRSILTAILHAVCLVTLFGIATLISSAQDLGSSNKLFGGAKKETSKVATPAPKKTAAKPPVTKKVVSKAAKPAKRSPSNKEKTPVSVTASTKKPVVKSPAPDRSKPVSAGTKKTSTEVLKTPANKSENAAKGRFQTFSPAPSRTNNFVSASSPDYERLIDQGNDARDDRNYMAAEAAYKKARAARPRDPRAIYGLGNLYSDQQRWDEAEAAYRAALQLDPSNPIAHVALSYVLIQPISVDNLADRYEEAEKTANKAIELSPRDPLAYDQLGVAMELRGLIGAETENAYKRAISLDPNFAPAYAHLGRLLRRRGRIVESKDTYSKAIKLAADVPTKILVAEVMQSEQRFADSEGLLREAVTSDPRNPAALLGLGRALIAQNKLGEAETVLRKALDVSQDGYIASTLLASVYIRREVYETAEAHLVRVIKSVPSYEKRRLSQQFESIGDGYARTGRNLAAHRAYEYALDLYPDKESLMSKLGRTKRA